MCHINLAGRDSNLSHVRPSITFYCIVIRGCERSGDGSSACCTVVYRAGLISPANVDVGQCIYRKFVYTNNCFFTVELTSQRAARASAAKSANAPICEATMAERKTTQVFVLALTMVFVGMLVLNAIVY